jgi:hypothetical protein
MRYSILLPMNTPKTDKLWSELEQLGWKRDRLPVSKIMASHQELEIESASNNKNCSSFGSISEEGLKQHHWNHLRAAEEMARAHVDHRESISVLLEFHPEMGDRTESLSVLLREVFKKNL